MLTEIVIITFINKHLIDRLTKNGNGKCQRIIESRQF